MAEAENGQRRLIAVEGAARERGVGGEADLLEILLGNLVVEGGIDDLAEVFFNGRSIGKVTEDMPEETVNMLFEKAVPAWMDFQYFVAELRRAYLLKQLTSAEK